MISNPFISYSDFAKQILLRSFYISDKVEIVVRYANCDPNDPNQERDHFDEKLSNVIQKLFRKSFCVNIRSKIKSCYY